MPRYEFMCEKCKKSFELTMTISEREKAKVPDVQRYEGGATARRIHGADGEEELMTSPVARRASVADAPGERLRPE
jgi:putative FmdB family regulatory protein